MKKKLLLTIVAIAALLCAFAVSITAQEIKKFATDEFQSGDNVTHLEGINEDMYLADTNRNNSFLELVDPNFEARAVLKNSDGTYTTYPAWYFITYTHYWNGAEYSYTVDRINAMSDVTGETYSTGSIIRYEFIEYKQNHGFSLKSYVGFGFGSAVYVRVPSHATSVSFRSCQKLVEIEYAPGANVTSISDKAFVDCHSIETIRIPNTATSMGSEIVCFWSTSSSTAALKEVYLGANMASLGTKNPLNTANVSGLKIYVPATLDGSKYTFSAYFHAKTMIIFTGTKEQAEAFGALKTISYEEYAKTNFAYEAGTIVYGYSECVAFYDGVHTYGDESEKFLGSEYVTDYVVASTCEKCQTDTVIETICGPLFLDLGYSKAGDGSAFTYDIKLNKANIEVYENKTGKTLNYGFIVGSYTEGDSGDIIGTDGEAKVAKSVVTDFTDIKFNQLDKYSLKMTGIKESQYEMLIYCNAYINDGTAVSYLGAQNEENKALAISYTTLPAKTEE